VNAFAARGLTLLAGTAVALGLAEYAVRQAGWDPRQVDLGDEPTVFQDHPALGWEPVPGRHVWTDAVDEAEDIVHTITGEGHRAASYDAVEASRELVLAGGSFTQGWEVSDPETFAWRLQERLPEWKVVNLGVSGYGTYQSLLRLEEELPRLENPGLVVYGFIDHHEQRNVGETNWLRLLAQAGSGARTPRAGLREDGSIEHHGLAGYLFPLREHSALAALAEDAWLIHVVGELPHRKRDVTKSLLLRMNELAEGHGADFAVVFLHGEDSSVHRLTRFLDHHAIPSLDCTFPLTASLKVDGKGHPNEKAHGRWATCIRHGLAQTAVDVAPAPRHDG
jgi:hypothetical protein